MRLESATMNAIAETRRALTRLEFAAMEIESAQVELALTRQLEGIRNITTNAARNFAGNERQGNVQSESGAGTL